jgi:hypothetical protein
MLQRYRGNKPIENIKIGIFMYYFISYIIVKFIKKLK